MKRKRNGEKSGEYIFDYFQVSRSAIFILMLYSPQVKKKGEAKQTSKYRKQHDTSKQLFRWPSSCSRIIIREKKKSLQIFWEYWALWPSNFGRVRFLTRYSIFLFIIIIFMVII
jgi:hypothetical protein